MPSRDDWILRGYEQTLRYAPHIIGLASGSAYDHPPSDHNSPPLFGRWLADTLSSLSILCTPATSYFLLNFFYVLPQPCPHHLQCTTMISIPHPLPHPLPLPPANPYDYLFASVVSLLLPVQCSNLMHTPNPLYPRSGLQTPPPPGRIPRERWH